MSDTGPNESTLRKIRGLLDKAEATPFEAEQAALYSKAAELMARHRVTEAMLADAKPLQDRGKVTVRRIHLGAGPYVRARLALLGAVAQPSSCKVLTYVDYDGRFGEVHGYESDLDAVEMLYTSLLIQSASAMKAETVPRGQGAVEFRRSFLFGFAARVRERLDEVNQTVVDDVEAARTTDSADGAGTEGPSVALVLADRREDVEQAVAARYGRIGTLRRASKSRSLAGHQAGAAAGDRADLYRRDRVTAGAGALPAGR